MSQATITQTTDIDEIEHSLKDVTWRYPDAESRIVDVTLHPNRGLGFIVRLDTSDLSLVALFAAEHAGNYVQVSRSCPVASTTAKREAAIRLAREIVEGVAS